MSKVIGKTKKTLPTDFDALLRLFPPRSIHDGAEYDNMQGMIDSLTSIPSPSKGQSEYLETLAILFSAYEEEHYPINTDDISPLEILKHLMKENEMSASDLGRLLGERSLAPKILNGDRDMSKAHIRKLAARFAMSPALFI
jgi:HTH-type transcriptional regulator/antitoxin HigA